MPKTNDGESSAEDDGLIPDPEFAKMLGVSPMSLWRWRQDPRLKIPPPIKIRGRNYVPRSKAKACVRDLVKRAAEVA